MADLADLRVRKDELEKRLKQGADLIQEAEDRGERARADWLAGHFRKLLAEYEGLSTRIQELEHGK
jgi:predicted  nucleic acid-binding Zn-ribbon protein